MFGLIVLMLPSALGIGFAFWMGRKTNNALKEAVRRGERCFPIAVKHLSFTMGVVAIVSVILALLFAGLMDTLGGDTSFGQFVGYAKFQAICMSVFLLPAMVMAVVLGRKGE